MDGAVGAGFFASAVGAGDGGGEAAAVQEEHGLFAAGEADAYGFDEFGGEEGTGLAGLFFAFEPHVDDADVGHDGAVDALGQADETVFAGAGVAVGFEGGGRGAEEDGAALQGAAHDGDVAGVVVGGLVLLVGGLVFFVDDEEAEGADRREEGRAGAERDAGFAGRDALPFVVAFAVG